jgi:hypothetical protein
VKKHGNTREAAVRGWTWASTSCSSH